MQVRRKPVAEKIFKILKEDILNDKYRSNTYLPSENQLCGMFGSSRGTVRSVLADLERVGLIRINPGKGSCVTASQQSVLQRRFLIGPSTVNSSLAEESMQILAGICKGAAENNAEAIIAFDAIKDTKEIIERYISGSIDGVIYIECNNYAERVAPLAKAGVPCVVANLEYDMDCVYSCVDFRQVGRLAARHLIENGHKNCALLMGRSFFYKEMTAGFRGALAEENISLQDENIFLTDTMDEINQACEEILKDSGQFSALFAGRDNKASVFYQICRKNGVDIPGKMSIVSYDNITWNDASNSGLTTVGEPAEEMGRTAVGLLCKWITECKKPKPVILPGKLIKKRSVQKT